MRNVALGVMAGLLLSSPAGAGEDFFSTDFLWRLENDPDIYTFYQLSNAVVGNGVSGSSSLQKFGVMAALPRVDLFYVGLDSQTSLQRTNRYSFDFVGSSLGVRLHILEEKEGDPLGLVIGYQNEAYYPGAVFRNGTDLGITSPPEYSNYGFILGTKKVTDNLRVNAGVKLGTANVSFLNGYSRSYAAGLEYQVTDNFAIQGNYKLIELQGVPTNNNLGLRFKWDATDNVHISLNTDYYSKGLSGQYPVTYPLIPQDFFDRFGSKPQLTYGLQMGFTFGQGSPTGAALQKKNEEQWEDSLPVTEPLPPQQSPSPGPIPDGPAPRPAPGGVAPASTAVLPAPVPRPTPAPAPGEAQWQTLGTGYTTRPATSASPPPRKDYPDDW